MKPPFDERLRNTPPEVVKPSIVIVSSKVGQERLIRSKLIVAVRENKFCSIKSALIGAHRESKSTRPSTIRRNTSLLKAKNLVFIVLIILQLLLAIDLLPISFTKSSQNFLKFGKFQETGSSQ